MRALESSKPTRAQWEASAADPPSPPSQPPLAPGSLLLSSRPQRHIEVGSDGSGGWGGGLGVCENNKAAILGTANLMCSAKPPVAGSNPVKWTSCDSQCTAEITTNMGTAAAGLTIAATVPGSCCYSQANP